MRKLQGVYQLKGGIATENLTPGKKVYGEKLVPFRGKELRMWNPRRSKLAAAIHKGLKKLPLRGDSRVLYLGAAQGTTSSHLSDMAREGSVYCVEISPIALRKLLEVCTWRGNMVPILADASRPEEYLFLLEKVDLVYQDIAHPRQVEILKENARLFLKSGGYLFLALKARSISSVEKPGKIFDREVRKLGEDFKILQKIKLSPYEKDHLMVVAQRV